VLSVCYLQDIFLMGETGLIGRPLRNECRCKRVPNEMRILWLANMFQQLLEFFWELSCF